MFLNEFFLRSDHMELNGTKFRNKKYACPYIISLPFMMCFTSTMTRLRDYSLCMHTLQSLIGSNCFDFEKTTLWMSLKTQYKMLRIEKSITSVSLTVSQFTSGDVLHSKDYSNNSASQRRIQDLFLMIMSKDDDGFS